MNSLFYLLLLLKFIYECVKIFTHPIEQQSIEFTEFIY